MTFEKVDIRGEKLDQLVAKVEPLIQKLDLDFPVRIDDSLLVDEERGIYYLSFFTGSGFLSPPRKIILEKEGPYYFDGYENNPVTPYHWPAVEAIITPNEIIFFSYFEFFSAKPEDLTSNREFYISTLFIKNSEDNHIINIKSECEFPKEIYNLISKLINIRNQRKDWVITNHIKYNFSIDMLKGLRSDND